LLNNNKANVITIEYLIEESAILFSISAERYKNKWDDGECPLDAIAHILKLSRDKRLEESFNIIRNSQAWDSRMDIPRMFLREASKIHYLNNMARQVDEAYKGGPETFLDWLQNQKNWTSVAADVADALNKPKNEKTKSKMIAAIKTDRRNNKKAHVEYGRIKSRPPKTQVDGQLTAAELANRLKTITGSDI
jgi:hypothetical protein